MGFPTGLSIDSTMLRHKRCFVSPSCQALQRLATLRRVLSYFCLYIYPWLLNFDL
jgi:hypothetical protein